MTKKYGYKQVIVIRKDLKMRKGKMIAQGAHASLGAIVNQMSHGEPGSKFWQLPVRDQINQFNAIGEWLSGPVKKIVVYVESEAEINELERQAHNSGLIHCKIIDSGLTEFYEVPTITCIAIGPGEESEIDKITNGLPLL